MKSTLSIITVTKDDSDGVTATVVSTRKLRACDGVRQIVVDSSDAPVAEKVRALLDGEANLDYSWQAPSGIASAFNSGIIHSSADWLWFLNGRDEVHPELDTQLLLQILNSSRADVVIFQIEYMDSKVAPRKRPPLWLLWPPMYSNWVPHPATFIRAHLFEQYGIYDTDFKIAMDADWWMRVFSQNVTVDMLSFPVTLYDLNGVSATNFAQTDKEARRIIRKNIGMLVSKWLSRGVHLFRAYTKL